MSALSGRRRRMVRPSLLLLESRRLLTVSVSWDGQDGVDLVGPTVAVGPDGIQDVHLHLSMMQSSYSTGTTIQTIVATNPSGFEWEYHSGNSRNGWANAEFFYMTNAPTDWSQGDIYLNPTIDSNLSNGSSGQPLGSSTGPPITLANGDVLNFTVMYSNGNTDTGSKTVSGLTQPPAAMTTTPAPANVQPDTLVVTNDGQASEGQFAGIPKGYVHLNVTGLTGAIASATISDQAGWIWTSPSGPSPMVQGAPDEQSADIFFPPNRNEAVCPQGVSASTDMALRIAYATGPTATQYFTQFPGGAWDPSLMATNPQGNLVIPNSSNSVMASDLIGALEFTSGTETDTVELPAGATITLTQPLEINHSVDIVGNGATIQFAASWTSATHYAIYLDPNTKDRLGIDKGIQIDFSDFNIDFGASNIWYNPETNDPTQYSVIDLQMPSGYSYTANFSGMNITGPPALDPEIFQNDIHQNGPPDSTYWIYKYVGEPATQLVDMAQGGNGSITGCTFQGGPVTVSGGPWKVIGNTHLGARAQSYGLAAFTARSPHDLIVEGNHVAQNDPNGVEFRLINFANSSYNDLVFDNTFVGGSVGNEQTFVWTGQGTGYYQGLNDPEIILEESDSIFYEGSVGTVSQGGWVLTLPVPSASIASRGWMEPDSTGPGMVVSIINTKNSDGSPNSLAGEWFTIAQQISESPPTFLMNSPLPAGSYSISVGNGFTHDEFLDNVLNMTGKSSTGIDLVGNNYGVTIEHNTIIGGTIYDPAHGAGTAILVQSYITNASYSNSEPSSYASQEPLPFGIPYAWTYTPALGITIEYNTIVNSVGGLILDVQHLYIAPNPSFGRLYLEAMVQYNTFEWTQDWLNWWGATGPVESNGQYPQVPINSTDPPFYWIWNDSYYPVHMESDSYLPPSITVGDGSGAREPLPSTVGGNDGYIDPYELSVTIQGNTAYTVNSSGSLTARAEPSGQVYDGVVNGVVSASAASFPYLYTNVPPGDTLPYAPFDADNLNISGSPESNPSLSVLALNQDGGDLVGHSGNSGPDGIQDEHIQLTGLNPTLAVTSVGLSGPGIYYEYNAPFGSNNTDGWARAELVRQGLAPVGDFYFELNQGMSPNTQFSITVVYSNGSSQTATFSGVSVPSNPNAPMPSLFATSLNQDGVDLVGQGPNSGPDGTQDVDILIGGLNTALGVTSVFVQGPNDEFFYGSPMGSDNSGNVWRAELVRQARSPYADLYFQLDEPMSPSSMFTLTVGYSNGTSQTVPFVGVTVSNPFLPDGQVANPNLPMPTLAAIPLNYNGVDLVGKGDYSSGLDSEPDGNQDVDIQLVLLNTSLDVASVVLASPYIYDQYNAPFGSNNTDGMWRIELVRQGRAPVADLYFQPNQGISPSTQFTVTITYTSGATQSATFSGVTVNYFQGDGTSTNYSASSAAMVATGAGNGSGTVLGGSRIIGSATPTETRDVAASGSGGGQIAGILASPPSVFSGAGSFSSIPAGPAGPIGEFARLLHGLTAHQAAPVGPARVLGRPFFALPVMRSVRPAQKGALSEGSSRGRVGLLDSDR